MNIPALQATLRQFAADRDWQAFHTPKNLAMALMVEAAELAEIFQWLTPEQSVLAHQDAAQKARIADELADVLLYLLQLADHTACDLNRAVTDKLVKNARKHPAGPGRQRLTLTAGPDERQAAAAAPDAGVAPSLHVLLDFENVQPDEAELRALVPGLTHLWLFHGPHQKDLAQRFAGFGRQLTLVPISQSGKNALDFHLSFYAGYIVSRFPQAALVVVANDKGYAPMLMHADTLGFDVRQVGHARVSAAKRAAARKAAAAAPGPVVAHKPVRAAAPKPAARRASARPMAVAVAAPAKPAPARSAPAKRTPAKTARSTAATADRQAVAPTPARRPAPAPAPASGSTSATAPRPGPDAAPALSLVRRLARRAGAGPAAAPAPAPGPRPTPAAAPASAVATVVPARAGASARKLLASLRKMGDSLPTRQGRLLSILKSLLGPDASAADALAALARLVSAGQVVVAPGGAVSYRL